FVTKSSLFSPGNRTVSPCWQLSQIEMDLVDHWATHQIIKQRRKTLADSLIELTATTGLLLGYELISPSAGWPECGGARRPVRHRSAPKSLSASPFELTLQAKPLMNAERGLCLTSSGTILRLT